MQDDSDTLKIRYLSAEEETKLREALLKREPRIKAERENARISEYELTKAIPDSLKLNLPSIQEIEAELNDIENNEPTAHYAAGLYQLHFKTLRTAETGTSALAA